MMASIMSRPRRLSPGAHSLGVFDLAAEPLAQRNERKAAERLPHAGIVEAQRPPGPARRVMDVAAEAGQLDEHRDHLADGRGLTPDDVDWLYVLRGRGGAQRGLDRVVDVEEVAQRRAVADERRGFAGE